jgi:hypothetical protein
MTIVNEHHEDAMITLTAIMITMTVAMTGLDYIHDCHDTSTRTQVGTFLWDLK